MPAGAPSPDSRQAWSPSRLESRSSSWWTRADWRAARCGALSRSACSEALLGGGSGSREGWCACLDHMDLFEQVAVTVEERPVDPGGAGEAPRRCESNPVG